jgi:hypothetical protein
MQFLNYVVLTGMFCGEVGCGNSPLHEKLMLDGKTSVNLINVILAVEWLLSQC